MQTEDLRVTTTESSQWGRVLSIEVPRGRYDAARAAVLRDVRRQVTRPGFRKGHVPTAIVERDFADRIESDALEKFIPSVCDQAITHAALDVISTPRVRNLVLDDPAVVRFDLELEVRPKLTIGSLEGLAATRPLMPIDDSHVEHALGEIRTGHAQFAVVEREARDGDVVVVSYVPLDDTGQPRAAQRVENQPFELGAHAVVEDFENAVRGRKAGDEARAAIDYPAEYGDPELAGKRVAFLLTVQGVKEKRLPELDDEFARDLGAESLDDLRARVRADLERRARDESENELRESLVEALIAAHPFEPPASLVERYRDAMWKDYEERAGRAGQTLDDATRQQFQAAMQPVAERSVRRGILLDAVSEQHQLQASEEDVDRWIEQRVEAGGSGATEMRSFFAERSRRRRLKNELTETKVFEFLQSRADITEVQRAAAPEVG
jgi:trigger factor